MRCYDLPPQLVRAKGLPKSIWSAYLEPGPHCRDDARRTGQPIRIGGSILCSHRHICCFFNNDDEQHRVLLPFIKAVGSPLQKIRSRLRSMERLSSGWNSISKLAHLVAET